MKKKLLSVALATIMAMSLSATAFAEGEITNPSNETDGYVDEVYVGVTKNVTDGSGISVAETYKFTVTEVSATDTSSTVEEEDWAIDDFEIAVNAESTSATGKITLPTYTSVGVYTYTIAETAGNILGVTYDTAEYTMTVTVIKDETTGAYIRVVNITNEDGDKVDQSGSGDSEFSFTNTYTTSTLEVSKELSGNFTDPTKDFAFTITFKNETSKEWTNAIDAQSYTATSNEDGSYSYTITLKGGENFTFSNIPYDIIEDITEGVTYTVTEDNYTEDGYTTYVGSIADENKTNTATGTVDAGGEEVTIINVKGEAPDTGINLDGLPYIMILAVVILGAAYVILRKRVSDNY